MVTVDNDGLARGESAGQSTVTASLGEVEGSTVLTGGALGRGQAEWVPLSTSHPAVPTNMFSATLKSRHEPELRRHRSDTWLLAFGDKLCHSTGSLLVYLSQGLKGTSADPESRRGLFPLYLQAALAETRLQMNSKRVSRNAGDAMLDCITMTILDTPLAQLDRYAGFLAMEEDGRRDAVAREAVQMIGVASVEEQNFRAAYVLLRTVVIVMVLQRSFKDCT